MSGPYPEYQPRHARRKSRPLANILLIGLVLMACSGLGIGILTSSKRVNDQYVRANTALSSEKPPTPKASHTPTGAEDVTLVDCKSDKFGVPYADLKVTNHGTENASYFITVSFNDESGYQIDTASGVIDSLDPGKTATTKAELISIVPVAYKTCAVVDVSKI